MIGGAVISCLLFGGLIYASIEMPEERAAREAKEEAERVAMVESANKAFNIKIPAGSSAVDLQADGSSIEIWCDDPAEKKTLLEFETDLSKDQLVVELSKTLGEADNYSYLNDGEWSDGGVRIALTHIDLEDGSKKSAILCRYED